MNTLKQKLTLIISLIVIIVSSILIFAFAESATVTKIGGEDMYDIGIGGTPAYCLCGDRACIIGDTMSQVATVKFTNEGVVVNGGDPMPYNDATANMAWIVSQPHGASQYKTNDTGGSIVINGVTISPNCSYFPGDVHPLQKLVWQNAVSFISAIGAPSISPSSCGRISPITNSDMDAFREKAKNSSGSGEEAELKVPDGKTKEVKDDDDTHKLLGPIELNGSEVKEVKVTNDKGEDLAVEYMVYEGSSLSPKSTSELIKFDEFYVRIDMNNQDNKDRLKNSKKVTVQAKVASGGLFSTEAEVAIWENHENPDAQYQHQDMMTILIEGKPGSPEDKDLSLDFDWIVPERGELIIHKYHLDASGERRSVDLPGAEFTIKNSEGKYVKADNPKEEGKEIVYELTEGEEFTDSETKFKTGEDSGDEATPPEQQDTGRGIHIKNLPVGTYTIEEVTAPRTFELSTNGDGGTSKQTAVIEEGKTDAITLEFHNEKLSKGKLIIGKYEADENGEAKTDVGLLGGAKFSIKNPDGFYLNNTNFSDSTLKYTEANISDKCTTAPTKDNPEDNHLFETTEGKELTFEDLPFGAYTIEEVIAPDGYELSTNGDNGGNIQTADIQSGGAIQLTRNFHNEKKPDGPGIEIEKVEADGDGTLLPGAKFAIKGPDPAKDGEVAENNGYIKSTGYTPGEEFKVPEENWSSTTSVTEDDSEYLFSTGDGEEGSTIKLTGLRAGTYTIEEIVAPEGYELPEDDSKTQTVEVKDDAEAQAVKVTFEDEKGGDSDLEIEKVEKDSEDGKILPGALFAISGPEGETKSGYIKSTGYTPGQEFEVPEENWTDEQSVDTGKTEYLFSTGDGEEGSSIKLKGLRAGKYTVTEVKAPEGYTLPTDGSVTQVVEVPGEGKVTFEDEKKKGKIEIEKVDEEGNPLTGATFTIYNEDEKKYVDASGELTESAVDIPVDSDGKISLEVPEGSYTVVETNPPNPPEGEEGEYELDDSPHSTSVPQDSPLKITNKLKDESSPSPSPSPSEEPSPSPSEGTSGSSSFRKIIKGTSKGLEGFEFEFSERPIEEEKYDEIKNFTGAGCSDFYSGPAGHCAFLPCTKTDSPVPTKFDAMGNPIEFKCSLHGRDESHCDEWNQAKEEFNKLVDDANSKHGARESAISEINTLVTDENGNGDVSPFSELNDDEKGIIDLEETSVGSNPYFNRRTEKWEDVDYLGNMVFENERKRADLEGLIWEDNAEMNKDGRQSVNKNNTWDEGAPDQLAHPVEVRIYTSGGEEFGKGVLTEDGHYRIRVGGKDGEDLEKLSQDPYIEFTYNGIKYQCVPQALIDQDNGSKALESISDRNSFNDRYDVIASNGGSGDVNSTLADSDGTVMRYVSDGEYKRKITYEGSVTGGFSRDAEGAATSGDAKYTVEKMPGANEDPETEQTGVNKRDSGYADKCHYITGKDGGDKYQIKATTKEAGFSIAQKYQEEIVSKGEDTIKNINLGIYKREQPDISIANDVYKAMIMSNVEGNQQYMWYTYGEKTKDPNSSELFTNDSNLGVRFGKNNGEGYKREVAPSEVKAAKDKKFKSYVVYRTIIRNESTTLTMQSTEIISNYDKDYVRVENVGENIGEKGVEGNGDVQYQVDWKWKEEEKSTHMSQPSSTHNASGNYQSAYGRIDTPIEPNGGTITIYTLYEFGRQQAWDMYNNPDEIVPFYNHVEVNAYTTSSDHQDRGLNPTYAGVDVDSACGNSTPGNEGEPNDTYEDDNDDAPVFKLKREENRTLKGKVFLDQIQNPSAGPGEEYIGDGMTNEPGLAGVRVELVELNDDGSEKLWSDNVDENALGTQPDGVTPNMKGGRAKDTTMVELDPNPDSKDRTEQALTYTKENGEWEFKGFIPGRYIIKYTWGGHSSTVPVQVTGTDDWLYPEQYKSTIFVDQNRYNSYTNVSEPTRWLLPEVSNLDYQGKSNAIDDMGKRKEIDDSMHKVNGKDNYVDVDEKRNLMYSRTPAFEVGVEATVEDNEANDATSKGSEQKLLEATDLDFGICERPTMDMSLTKKIERMRITLANGQVLVDASVKEDGTLDGSTLNTIYTKPGDSNPQIGRLKTEMDQEIMHGATMELTYDYTVFNKSNLDFVISGETSTNNPYHFAENIDKNKYYKFGTSPPAEEEVVMEPTLIVDYLDNKMNYLRKGVDDLADPDLVPPPENDYWERLTDDKQSRIKDALFDSRSKYLYDTNPRYEYEDLTGYEDIEKRMSAINTTYWSLLRDQNGAASAAKITLKAGETNKDVDVPVKLVASKVLSDTSEDLVYYNTAEIIQIDRTGGEEPEPIIPGNVNPGEEILDEHYKPAYQPTTNPAKEGDSSTAEEMTITPPTGDINYNYEKGIWTIVAITSLGVLGAGTAVIRRIIYTKQKKENTQSSK